MSDRQPNEVLIAPEVLHQLLSEGGARVFSVKNGPAPEAEIIGVEWRYVNGAPLIVLVYSSDVPEPVLTHEHGLEALRDEVRVMCKLSGSGAVVEGGSMRLITEVPHIAALLRSGAQREE